MSANEAWMLAGMVAVTFGIRYLLFGLADRIRLAPWLSDSLKFIPPAVLTAITLPAVLLPKRRLAPFTGESVPCRRAVQSLRRHHHA
jgi:branched-subunit amino acid transport protein